MSQSIHVPDSEPSTTANTRSNTPDPNASSKPLLNPLKALKTFSATPGSSNELRQSPLRLTFDDPVDLGDVSLDGPWLGLCSMSVNGLFQTVTWSTLGFVVSMFDPVRPYPVSDETQVHVYDTRSSRCLFTHDTSEIRDVQWVDSNTCVILCTVGLVVIPYSCSFQRSWHFRIERTLLVGIQ